MQFKDYLIPTEKNDYKPWIITPTALVVFCVVIWGIRIFIPTAAVYGSASIDAGVLMSKVNFERTQRFIPALNTNSKLITASNGKAHDMLARSYFAHVDPDGNYVWGRIEAAGYTPYVTLGENLAMDFTSAQQVVDAWMNSPTHRANIVNSKFEDQGLSSIAGTFEPNHDTVIVVSLFGTLYKTVKASPPAPTPVVTNPSPTPGPTPTPIHPPTPAPVPPVTTNAAKLLISKDAKINSTSLSGQTRINLNIVIQGAPTLVTAQLKTQSITLLKGTVSGEFIGAFTFDSTENLSSLTMTVEARDQTGNKISETFPINVESQTASAQTNAITQIPVSNEAQVIKILRIVFGIFSIIYVIFLIIDAIIIHRAKINRPSIHTTTHALIFLLIAAVSFFVK